MSVALRARMPHIVPSRSDGQCIEVNASDIIFGMDKLELACDGVSDINSMPSER